MMIKYLSSFLLAIASTQLLAFPCYFTLAKDSCWTNYDVKVMVLDAAVNQPLITVDVPKGKSWTRQTFDCHIAQKLMYQATFDPVFWESEKGKTYMALRYWFLPGSITAGETAWEIPVCFPSDFSAVPLPPDAVGNCKCDFTRIPPVKPLPLSPPPTSSHPQTTPQPANN